MDKKMPTNLKELREWCGIDIAWALNNIRQTIEECRDEKHPFSVSLDIKSGFRTNTAVSRKYKEELDANAFGTASHIDTDAFIKGMCALLDEFFMVSINSKGVLIPETFITVEVSNESSYNKKISLCFDLIHSYIYWKIHSFNDHSYDEWA